MSAIVVIYENKNDPSASIAVSRIHDDMDKLGYTKVAAQIALEKLRRKGFVDVEVRNIYD